ncbi:hypothetical protein [Clostridium perfringens]|uniref:hypothetical protein n=1 Tax=Clostridium perfringens TaxID=1502 RepID=UPI0034A17B9A
MELTKELLKNNICKDEKQLNKYINKFPQAYEILKTAINTGETISKRPFGKKHGHAICTIIEKLFGSWAEGVDILFPELGGYNKHIKAYRLKVISEGNTKGTVAEAIQEIKKRYENGESISKTSMKYLGKRLEEHYGTYEDAVEDILGISYDKWYFDQNSTNKKYTIDQWVARLEQILSDKNRNGLKIPKTCPKEAVDVLISKYGSIDSAELLLSGKNSETRKKERENQAIQTAIEDLKTLYFSNKPITKNRIPSRIHRNIAKAFGSYEAGVEELFKINYEEYQQSMWRNGVEKGRNITAKWDKESLKDWLLKRLEAGEPCNFTAVQNKHVFSRIIDIYGTYSALWEACNLNYEEYKQNLMKEFEGSICTLSYQLSLVGYSFENLMDNIISSLGIGYTKHQLKGTKLMPDYIMQDGEVLGDAKLTYGYNNTHETIKKYSPYCTRLELYFLNSNFEYKQSKVNNTDIIYYNVDKLIKCLPEEQQEVYSNKVRDLRKAVEDIYKKYKTPCTA